MKKISNHLGEIIIALACVAVLISAVTVFAAPISDFFSSIVTKETDLGDQVVTAIGDIDVSNIGVNGSGGGGAGDGDSGGGEGGESRNEYTLLDGDGQIYELESGNTLMFRSDAPYSKFASVKVDGTIVDPSNFTVSEGSTVITFAEGFGDDLLVGEHDIEIVSSDGSATGDFNVTDVNMSNFYTYTLKGGWAVGLNAAFKTALNKNTDYVVDGETLWTVGSPLPNAGAFYNGYPITSMSGMFDNCETVESLDLSEWDTSNIISMQDMFYRCKALKELDLSSFDTSKVVSMNRMFSLCYALEDLNVASFDTSNVTDMYGMFSGCLVLPEINVSRWDTSNVTDMSGMFRNCREITSLDLSSFDTSKVTNMENMFSTTTTTKLTSIVARTSSDKAKFEASSNFPSGCTVTVK